LARNPRPPQQRIASWLERFREQGYDQKAFALTNESIRNTESTERQQNRGTFDCPDPALY
jgi:hypothetical protein